MEPNFNSNPSNNQIGGNTPLSNPQSESNYDPKKSYSKKSSWKWVLLYLVIGAVAYAAVYYSFFYNRGSYNYSPQQYPNNSQAINSQLGFVPLTTSQTPPFLKNIRTETGIKVGFHYDGDYTSQNDWGYEQNQFYTPPGSNEKFLVVSKVKDRQSFDYGSNTSLPIFKSEESHSYQGTPIYVTNVYDKYSLSYLGFKINDKSLLSDLTVELGIDYNAQYYNGSAKSNSFSIASLLGIQTAYACGPGEYLRKVGNSKLNFVQEADGVAWYKLETPIAIYNLRLEYADQDCSTMPSYCKDQAEDPQDCDKYWSCYWNAKIDDLTKGNLRMHIYYKPNDKEGLLGIQTANVIFSDISGKYAEATMGEYFDHYYRAYLH